MRHTSRAASRHAHYRHPAPAARRSWAESEDRPAPLGQWLLLAIGFWTPLVPGVGLWGIPLSALVLTLWYRLATRSNPDQQLKLVR